MEDTSQPRSRVRRTDVLIVAAVIFLLISLILPAAQSAVEAARRTSCTSYLKQLALSLHNYHDVYNEFPPLHYRNNHWSYSWIAGLLPFVEQNVTARRIDLNTRPFVGRNDVPTRTFRYVNLHCPTRGGRITGGGPTDLQFTDYGAVACTTWGRHDWLKHGSNPNDFGGMFMSPKQYDAGPGKPLKSRTTYKSVVDGLSNTAAIGEMYLYPPLQENTTYGGTFNLTIARDQRGVRVLGDNNALVGDMRRDPRQDIRARFGFGSWHPGVTLVALGDGSVRAVNNYTSAVVLGNFAHCADGVPFVLP